MTNNNSTSADWLDGYVARILEMEQDELVNVIRNRREHGWVIDTGPSNRVRAAIDLRREQLELDYSKLERMIIEQQQQRNPEKR